MRAADGSRGFRTHRTGEYTKPVEDRALLGGQQLVRPADDRGQRAVPFGHSRSEREHLEPVPERTRQRPRRHCASRRRRQLDGERQIIEPRADLCHAVIVGSEPGLDRSGTIDEHSGGGRGVERLHRPEVLTADAHAFPARGQDIDAGCVLHDSLDEPTYGPGEVLAVVEDEEETTAGQLGDDLVGYPAERPFAYTDGGGDGTIHVGGPSGRTQIAESDAVPVAVSDVGGRFEREPGLADPAGTAQRHDSRLAERARNRRHIAIAPQETVGRSGQCAVRGNDSVLQDALFELAELRRRFEAPLDELASPALIHGERVGVASRLVQRLHEELAGVLALGMLDDQCLKVGDHLVVFPACQLRLRVAFPSGEAEFLEPYGLSAGELALRELHQRWPAPEG